MHFSFLDQCPSILGRQISNNPRKQREMANCGGVELLLGMCEPKNNTEARLLVPVLWSLRNCLHSNTANKYCFVTAGGLETLSQARHASTIYNNFTVADAVTAVLPLRSDHLGNGAGKVLL